jgi:hypothetical protein
MPVEIIYFHILRLFIEWLATKQETRAARPTTRRADCRRSGKQWPGKRNCSEFGAERQSQFGRDAGLIALDRNKEALQAVWSEAT